MQAKSSVYSSAIKVAPIECQRGGDHEGEVVMSVCLEPACKLKVCCSVCLMEHPGHKTESIKVRIKNARENLSAVAGKDTQASMLCDTINETKNDLKANVDNLRQTFLKSLQQIDCLIEKEFDMMEQRLNLIKNSGEYLTEKITNAKNVDDLTKLMDHIQSLTNILKLGPNPYLTIAEKVRGHKDAIFKLVIDLRTEYLIRESNWKSSLNQIGKLEEPKKPLICDKRHELVECATLPPNYIGGIYICNKCRSRKQVGPFAKIWHCNVCNYDLCPQCSTKQK